MQSRLHQRQAYQQCAVLGAAVYVLGKAAKRAIEEVEALVIEVGKLLGGDLKPVKNPWKQWPLVVKETATAWGPRLPSKSVLACACISLFHWPTFTGWTPNSWAI